ncbi:acyltransferase family protein, partial [Pseudomonas sp.]|uniref:acyltransferase family protein n=1 Tax=Pseudomonas sp. TaxID=306 RepID=UPI003CC5DD8B
MLISLQALRALAAWTVVCHHFMQIFFDFHASGPIGQFFVDRGAVGVDIFFVISGLVIYLSTQDKEMPAGRFLLNRAIRIVPAYWFYTLLMGLMIVAVGQQMPHQVVDLPHFILSLLFIPSENPGGYGLYPTLNVGWTLNYEMFFYLMFSLVFVVPKRHRPLVVGLALFAVCEMVSHYGVLSRFYANNIIYEFLLGIGIGWAYRRGWIPRALWVPLVVIAASLVAIYNLPASDRLLNWGVPSALIVLSCVAMEPWFKGNRLLKTLGDCSYSVYLIHVLVLY